jgi:tripartite-type tricarboxylate transporter receptor subunit TctC
MTMMRLKVALFVAMCFMAVAGHSAAQSEYPDRVVRFLNSGGAGNIVSRILADKLAELLGKPFVVETVAGAGGILAATRTAKSTPDGYTILMASEAGMTTNVALYAKLPYDPLKDFAPIGLAVDTVNILAVHPSFPAKSLQELVAMVRAEPGKFTFAAPGIGTSPHIAGELLKTMAKINMLLVPYRDDNAVIPDLLGGRVTMFFGNIGTLAPLVRAGQLRGLAVTSATRVPSLPDLPSIAESGYPGYRATTWVGALAPAGTAEGIVFKLNEAMLRALKSPDVQARFVDLGYVILGSTPSDMRQQIADGIGQKIKIIRDAGIKPQ